VTTARKDLTSWERMALQVLIWCVSDPPQPDSAYEHEDDRIQTCADSFDEEDRAHVLAQIPDDPEIEILFGASGGRSPPVRPPRSSCPPTSTDSRSPSPSGE